MDPSTNFDVRGFMSALDGVRVAKSLSWRGVARETHIAPSTLTRISQGRTPDVNVLAALCGWAGLTANDFFRNSSSPEGAEEPLAQALALFRADASLDEDATQMLEKLVTSTYETLRQRPA